MNHVAAKQVAVRAVVLGRVQRVGYRDWTCCTADRLGVWGWVRNLPDGAVELLAVGPEAQVQALLAACAEGPPHAAVEKVESRPWQAEPRMPDGAPLGGFLRAR
ncbi:acylphosphatase [Albimonas sp. CAU 1670]|uniref:acylphosphatase n=1 Tax=Albimonas sp. CAU 1670 TaxID=3032599 RepID=UPI0023DBC668|nr:acylphosphatase [Albimonas sp. CAU 1670]MDF2234369.1 acylphosphatase [Albimonas sp. CAU 1670]